MTRPLRIGLDIDGVIAQYKDIPPEDRTPDVYDKLTPVSPEVMATFAALAMCYEVFLVSSRRYPGTQAYTLRWLKHWLPDWAKGVRFELLTDVAPGQKWMVAKALKLDVFVDDKEGVFDTQFYGDNSDHSADKTDYFADTIAVLVGGPSKTYPYLIYDLTELPKLLTEIGWDTEFEWETTSWVNSVLKTWSFQPYHDGVICDVRCSAGCSVDVAIEGEDHFVKTSWKKAIRAAREAAAVL